MPSTCNTNQLELKQNATPNQLKVWLLVWIQEMSSLQSLSSVTRMAQIRF